MKKEYLKMCKVEMSFEEFWENFMWELNWNCTNEYRVYCNDRCRFHHMSRLCVSERVQNMDNGEDTFLLMMIQRHKMEEDVFLKSEKGKVTVSLFDIDVWDVRGKNFLLRLDFRKADTEELKAIRDHAYRSFMIRLLSDKVMYEEDDLKGPQIMCVE